MKIASRDDVVTRSADVQLVEVLPVKQYTWAHIPGALSIPLRELHRRAPRELDPARPIITYCHDLYCDLGPRAAAWLAHNGFADVAEYAAGKMDWIGAGNAYEGSADLVGRHLEPAPTCRASDPVAAVADVLTASPVAVVVDEDGVVVAVLDEQALEHCGGGACAWEVGQFGPPTVRPSEQVDELDRRLKEKDRDYILVSDHDGKLLGVYQPV
jgi:rhodanese-related sulfurtransferase